MYINYRWKVPVANKLKTLFPVSSGHSQSCGMWKCSIPTEVFVVVEGEDTANVLIGKLTRQNLRRRNISAGVDSLVLECPTNWLSHLSPSTPTGFFSWCNFWLGELLAPMSQRISQWIFSIDGMYNEILPLLFPLHRQVLVSVLMPCFLVANALGISILCKNVDILWLQESP